MLLVITIIRFIFINKKAVADLYLSLSFVALLHLSIVIYFFHTGQLGEFVHLFKTGSLVTYVLIGTSYLYIHKSILNEKFKKTDLLAFLPALFYLMDMLPFFMQPAEIKRAVLNGMFTDNQNGIYAGAWITSERFHYIGQNVFGLFMACFQLVLITKYVKAGGKHFYKENRSLVFWLYAWSAVLLLACLPDGVNAITGYLPTIFMNWYFSPTLFVIVFYPISLLLAPAIVRSEKGRWVYVSAQDQLKHEITPIKQVKEVVVAEEQSRVVVKTKPEQVANTDHQLKVYFKPEIADKMKAEIDHYMSSTRGFLDSDFSINRLAEDLGYTSRQLSSLLNSHSLTTFKDYVNRYRINLFIEKYKNDPESNAKTMEELAMECGFQNRYTFIHAFKRIKGKTPSAYFSRMMS